MSIDAYKEVLVLCPPDDPWQYEARNNLGVCLKNRYLHLRNMIDLEDSIKLHDKALSLCQQGHLNRPQALCNLGDVLGMIFDISKDMEYYNQCVNICRESILMYPDNNPERFSPFVNLGGVFFEFYKENGEVSVICEGLDYYRDALKLCPPDHPLRYNVLGGHSRS